MLQYQYLLIFFVISFELNTIQFIKIIQSSVIRLEDWFNILSKHFLYSHPNIYKYVLHIDMKRIQFWWSLVKPICIKLVQTAICMYNKTFQSPRFLRNTHRINTNSKFMHFKVNNLCKNASLHLLAAFCPSITKFIKWNKKKTNRLCMRLFINYLYCSMDTINI